MICNGLKQTIFASSEFELLQMVSQLGTERCASEDVGCHNRKHDRDTGPPRRVNYEIPHWLERQTKHSLQGCGNLSLVDTF